MENSPHMLGDRGRKERKLTPWVKKIIGASALAGGLAFGVDQAWDTYQETQKQKEREEDRKKSIEMTDHLLDENTKRLDLLDEKIDFKNSDSEIIPSIDKSVDSLKGLLQDLEAQKEGGTVSYETLIKIQNLTRHIETNLDSSSVEAESLLSAVHSIDSNVEALSKIEASKELSAYMAEFLAALKGDKEIIKHISKHPSATERIFESIERYKDVFADRYVDSQITKDETVTALADSMHIGTNDENDRVVYTLIKMQKEGILNDFFESLGTKINAALIAGKFKNRISLSKNFVEVQREESLKILEENPNLLAELGTKMGRPVTKEEALDVAAVSHIFYSSAHDFFALFSKDNTEEVEEFIKDMTKSEKLSESQKEEITNLIRGFGKKIQDFIIRLEASEK